jgi:hypothetical protein
MQWVKMMELKKLHTLERWIGLGPGLYKETTTLWVFTCLIHQCILPPDVDMAHSRPSVSIIDGLTDQLKE